MILFYESEQLFIIPDYSYILVLTVMQMKTFTTFIILLLIWTTCFGQDGSDMRYIPIKKLNKSFIGQFAHLDFYRKSYMGLELDTVVINIDGRPTKFIEHRKDDGFNNWFSQQYLLSLDILGGYIIKIARCKIDSITNDSIQVTNYLEYYDNHNNLLTDKSRKLTLWFKKEIINEVLIKSKQL